MLPIRVAAASGCATPGNDALRQGDYALAASHFAAARGESRCADDEVLLLLNEGFARQRLAEGGMRGEACTAAELYERVEALATDDEVKAVAAARIPGLRQTCEAHRSPVEPVDTTAAEPAALLPDTSTGADASTETSADLIWLWGTAAAFIVAGGVTYGFALAADSDRADARRDYARATAARDRPAWEAAAAEFQDARDATNTLGITSLSLLGIGVVLGGCAVGIGLGDDDEPITPVVSSRSVGVRGTF